MAADPERVETVAGQVPLPGMPDEDPDDWGDAHADDGSQEYWQCTGCGAYIAAIEELCGDCIEGGY